MRGSTPTKRERELWDRLAQYGCVACRMDGIINTHVSIHHIDGRTKPGAHELTLPLCFAHHASGSPDAPSVHPWRARFEAKYGKQRDLCARVKREIGWT